MSLTCAHNVLGKLFAILVPHETLIGYLTLFAFLRVNMLVNIQESFSYLQIDAEDSPYLDSVGCTLEGPLGTS